MAAAIAAMAATKAANEEHQAGRLAALVSAAAPPFSLSASVPGAAVSCVLPATPTTRAHYACGLHPRPAQAEQKRRDQELMAETIR